MKKVMVVLLVTSLSMGFSTPSLASDWDVAGKVLTGIAGLRILTRDNVDLIGNIAGTKNKQQVLYRKHHKHHGECHKYCQRVWIPHFKWKKKWIPAHKENHPKFGKVTVEGHYIKYKVKCGGYWDYYCDENYSRCYCK